MGNIEFDFYTSGQILQQVEDMIHRMNTEILNGFQDIIEWTSKSWDSESGNKFCDIAEKEMEKLKGTGEYFTGNLENEGTYFVNHAMKLWRISFDNFRTGQRTYMEFSGQMWIGRGSASQNSNVRLILSGDSKISRDHCTIYDAGRSLCIQDLKSSNHTYLNGKLVSSALYLKNGDVIRMGDTELKIEYSLVNNMYL